MWFSRKSSFTNIDQAKDFLVSKIAREAERSSSPLTDVERRKLYYSPTEPSTTWELKWEDAFEDEEFDGKMAALLSAAFQRDKAVNAKSEEVRRYHEAWKWLKEEDHVIASVAGMVLK
jgi:hypothetical protein